MYFIETHDKTIYFLGHSGQENRTARGLGPSEEPGRRTPRASAWSSRNSAVQPGRG